MRFLFAVLLLSTFSTLASADSLVCKVQFLTGEIEGDFQKNSTPIEMGENGKYKGKTRVEIKSKDQRYEIMSDIVWEYSTPRMRVFVTDHIKNITTNNIVYGTTLNFVYGDADDMEIGIEKFAGHCTVQKDK